MWLSIFGKVSVGISPETATHNKKLTAGYLQRVVATKSVRVHLLNVCTFSIARF